MIERVVIEQRWHLGDAHRVFVIGREHPGAPRSVLNGAGEWEPIPEGARTREDEMGIALPEGALAAIVAAAGDTTPQDATAAHLADAVAVRDRTLALVERIVDADLAREAAR